LRSWAFAVDRFRARFFPRALWAGSLPAVAWRPEHEKIMLWSMIPKSGYRFSEKIML